MPTLRPQSGGQLVYAPLAQGSVIDLAIRACLSSPRSCSSLFAATTSTRWAALARCCGVIATSAAASAACRHSVSVASGERSPDGVGEQPGQHVFPAEQDLPLIGEVPEERGAVQTGAVRDLRDGRFLVAVLHEQVQRGGLQALTRVRCPSAHRHILSDATGSHHLEVMRQQSHQGMVELMRPDRIVPAAAPAPRIVIT
jgi:hypothetical protein